MKKHSLYRDLAKHYDLIYGSKDYRAEAQKLQELIKTHQRSSGNDLLEVACGTGNHLQHFLGEYRVVGTDLEEEMLNIARQKLKDVEFIRQDMTKLHLKKQFDVILCLFSSIAYVKTLSNLRKTIKGFANHLKQGGVVILEGWFEAKDFHSGHISTETFQSNDLKLSRTCYSTARSKVSTVDMHYIVARRHVGVSYFMERHEVGLFDHAEFLKIMEDHGLKSHVIQGGLTARRGLFIGVKK